MSALIMGMILYGVMYQHSKNTKTDVMFGVMTHLNVRLHPHLDLNQPKKPTTAPTIEPSLSPTVSPSSIPSMAPSNTPTSVPTTTPTFVPSVAPVSSPTLHPSENPLMAPTNAPSLSPTHNPLKQPSLSPTIAPTFSPTLSPSMQPTNIPSLSPSIVPTTIPSSAPSTIPTVNPTVSPSNNPSIAPTANPTISPTIAPTQPPSASPTNIPSNTPSYSPTESPTFCLDFNSDNSTVIHDGVDIIRNIIPILSASIETQYNNTNDSMVYYENIGYRNQINCPHTEESCHIKCKDRAGCVQASIKAMNADLPQLTMKCVEELSCNEAQLSISNSTIDYMIIVCGAKNACESMKINISNSVVDKLEIYCTHGESCKALSIETTAQLLTDNSKLEIHCLHQWSCDSVYIHIFDNTTINCYNDNSCDNLILNSADTAYVKMVMRRYSNNVNIIHKTITYVDFKCGDENEKLFIRYNTHNSPSERELHDLGGKEFETNHMPCDGIHVDCTNNEHFPKQCTMEYSINPLDIETFLGTIKYVSCYWLNINYVFSASCNGNCNDDTTYFKHQQSIDFDINFDVTLYNKSVLSETCNNFFETINDTENTLNHMDRIFMNVLKIVGGIDSFTINDVLTYPYTVLRDGFIDCNNSFDTIHINTNVTIQSGIENKDELDKTFNHNSVFVNESQRLLSNLFGVSVTVHTLFTNNILPGLSYKTAIISASVILICFVIIVAIIVCYYKRKHQQAVKSMEIHNAMVIILGIGEYTLSNQLPGVVADIKNIKRLFGKTLKYTVHGTHKQRWTKDETIKFLQDTAEAFARNIETVQYDALVVVYSGHGVQNCIITSDELRINKEFIQHIFSKHQEVRNVPRLFIYDACGGNKKRGGDGIDENDEEKYEEQEEQVEDMVIYTHDEQTIDWVEGGKNPNYKLAVIHSSNLHYQSYCGAKYGSVFIKKFVKYVNKNIENRNQSFLFEIIDRIHEELCEAENAQLCEAKYNTKTRYLKFYPKPISMNSENMINFKLKTKLPYDQNENPVATKAIDKVVSDSNNIYEEGRDLSEDEFKRCGEILMQSMINKDEQQETQYEFGENAESLLNTYILSQNDTEKEKYKKLQQCEDLLNDGEGKPLIQFEDDTDYD
eukprot:458737_1